MALLPDEWRNYPEAPQPAWADQFQEAMLRWGLGSGEAIAEVIGCTTEEGHWLYMTLGVVAAPQIGDPTRLLFVPASMYPAPKGRMLVDFRKLFNYCLLNVPKRRPQTEGRKAEHEPSLGKAVLSDSAWVREGLKESSGYAASSLPTPTMRVRNFDSIGISMATLADAIGTTPEQAKEWTLAFASDLPWSNGGEAFTKWTQAVRWASAGPTRPGVKLESKRKKQQTVTGNYY